MYELHPVRLSKRSSYVSFTDDMVEKLSAVRHLDGLNTPLVLAIGTCETPEFQRQSRDFAAAVKARGEPVELIDRALEIVPGGLLRVGSRSRGHGQHRNERASQA